MQNDEGKMQMQNAKCKMPKHSAFGILHFAFHI